MNKKFLKMACRIIFLQVLLILINVRVHAQEMPPRPINLQLINNLSFGTLSQGSGGGTVTVYPSGTRTSTGDIILLNYGDMAHPAIFELDGNPGTIVHLLAGSFTTLNGNQGGSLSMTYGDSDPVTPFILPILNNGVLLIYLGGVLTVGSPLANPPGVYNGSFDVMFIQE